MATREKINHYSKAIQTFLNNFADFRNNGLGNTMEYQVLSDNQKHHYQLVCLGWQGPKFVHFVLFHLDIKPDGKIWVQQNNTEHLLTEELRPYGISPSDIVVGFRPAYMRDLEGVSI